MIRKLTLGTAAIMAVVMFATPASALIPPEPVVVGPEDQFRPSSNGTFLAWTEFNGRRTNVFAQTSQGTARRRVNARGTQGWMGSFVQGTSRIVYQQVIGRSSDIVGYDVISRGRGKLGGGINTAEWEWAPVASSSWVLFLRDLLDRRGNLVRTKLMLADRVAGTVRTLDSFNTRSRFLIPTYAGQDFVAWTSCSRVTCRASYYNVITGATTNMPNPSETRLQYEPFIDEEAGQVYYVRSGYRCGQAVTFRRTALGELDPQVSTTIASLPRGIDTGWSMSLTQNPISSMKDLYFARHNCSQRRADIYVLRAVDSVPRVPVSRAPVRMMPTPNMPPVRLLDRMHLAMHGGSRPRSYAQEAR